MRKLTAINDNIATSNATGVARCAPIPGKIRLQIQNEFRGRYRAALSKGNEAGRARTHVARITATSVPVWRCA